MQKLRHIRTNLPMHSCYCYFCLSLLASATVFFSCDFGRLRAAFLQWLGVWNVQAWTAHVENRRLQLGSYIPDPKVIFLKGLECTTLAGVVVFRRVLSRLAHFRPQSTAKVQPLSDQKWQYLEIAWAKGCVYYIAYLIRGGLYKLI